MQNTLDQYKPNEINLTKALDALEDGIQTYVVPCFLADDRNRYIDAAIKLIQRELNKPKLVRIYLMFQEGIPKQRTRKIWETIRDRCAKLENANSDRVKVYSFGNVYTEVMRAFLGAADEGSVSLEIYDENK